MEENKSTAQEQLSERPVVTGKSKMQIFLVALLIFAVIGIAYILKSNGVFADKGYKKPINAYFAAICERDFDAYVGCMIEGEAVDYIQDKQEIGYSGYDYLNNLYSDIFEGYGDDVEVKIEFLGTERPNEAMAKEYVDTYKERHGEEISTENIYKVAVNATFAGSKGGETIKMDCYTIKLGQKWYIAGCDFTPIE